MIINKNDELIIDIEDIGSDGEGIGKYQGYTLFVKNTLPGDKVRVKAMKCKKKLRICQNDGSNRGFSPQGNAKM